jgi:hypothetical protein
MRCCSGGCRALTSLPATCHAAAFVGASPAGLGTFLAVAHLMFRAFFAACVAHFRTYLTDSASELASTRHVGGAQATDLGAIHIQCDAACQHFHILLLQASACTIVAGVGACIACFDAGIKLLMCHDLSP